jgi:hypothetical protein
MASSIYIIGILVSEDKSTRIFYQLMLYENIYSIIRSSTARRRNSWLILGNGCFSHLHQRYYGSIHTIFHQIAYWFRIPWTAPWWCIEAYFLLVLLDQKQQYSMARIFFFFLALAKFKTWNEFIFKSQAKAGFSPLLLTVMLPSNRFHRFYELPQDAQSDWNQCVYYFKFTWINNIVI